MSDFDGGNLEINALPTFLAYCPKHRGEMKQLQNGWFSKVWWCAKCEYPYELKLVKMRQFDRAEVDKQLAPTKKAIRSK